MQFRRHLLEASHCLYVYASCFTCRPSISDYLCSWFKESFPWWSVWILIRLYTVYKYLTLAWFFNYFLYSLIYIIFTNCSSSILILWSDCEAGGRTWRAFCTIGFFVYYKPCPVDSMRVQVISQLSISTDLHSLWLQLVQHPSKSDWSSDVWPGCLTYTSTQLLTTYLVVWSWI